MSNKLGLWEKIKVSWYWFTQPQYKNVLTVQCEFCGSTNIVAKNKDVSASETKTKNLIAYQAEYICMKCKAGCRCTQNWSAYKSEVIQKVKNQIQAAKG